MFFIKAKNWNLEDMVQSAPNQKDVMEGSHENPKGPLNPISETNFAKMVMKW